MKQKTKQPDKVIKGCLSFRVLRKLTNGYRTIKLVTGQEYDYVGIDVQVAPDYEVPICLEVLPNGLMNLYVISSNYEIEQPKGLHPTTGKLIKKQKLTEVS